METYKGTTLETKSIERYGNPTVDESKYKKTAYDYMFEKNKKREDNIAISYLGNEISYGEFKENTDMAAKVLRNLGLFRGDRVAVILPDMPESNFLQYGAIKSGIICDFIDPRTKADTLLKMLENENIKVVFVLDDLYDELITPIEDDLKERNIDKVVSVSPYLSASKIIARICKFKNTVSNLNKCKMRDLSLNYGDLLSDSKYSQNLKGIYVPDTPAIITHTSGSSTGVPKPITITNENMNAMAYQHELANLEYEPGLKLLHILPYFAAYGSSDCAHTGFSYGLNLQHIIKFDFSKIGRLIYKNKSNIVFGVPTWFVAMTKDPALKNADFSFLQCLVAGGDSLTKEDEIKINEWLKLHGAKCVVTKGYGMSELSGCATYTSSNANEYGSVGRALPLTEVAIVEPGTNKLVNFEHTSDIICGEALFKGPTCILKNDKISNPVTYRNIGDEEYLASGDIVSFDKNGIIRHIERMDRGFSRFDGYKIHPGSLEKKIMSYGYLQGCCISNYYDSNKNGKMPIIFCVLKDEYKELPEKEITSLLSDSILSDGSLTTRDLPAKWVFLEKLPLTPMSKIDFRALEKYDGNYTYIDSNEDNIKFSYNILSSDEVKLKKVI